MINWTCTPWSKPDSRQYIPVLNRYRKFHKNGHFKRLAFTVVTHNIYQTKRMAISKFNKQPIHHQWTHNSHWSKLDLARTKLSPTFRATDLTISTDFTKNNSYFFMFFFNNNHKTKQLDICKSNLILALHNILITIKMKTNTTPKHLFSI